MLCWGIGSLFFCELVFCETDGVDDVSGKTGTREVRDSVCMLTG